MIEALLPVEQRLKPGADVTAPGNGGKVVGFLQQTLFHQSLQNPKREGRTADAASRDGDSRKFPVETFLLPGPVAGGPFCAWRIASPRERHEQGDGVFRGGHGVAAGRVHHDDALAGGRGHVDVVHADARAGDGAALAGLVEEFGGEFGLRPADNRVRGADGGLEFVALEAGAVVHLDPGSGEQFDPGGFELVEAYPYDLIILDLMLPRLTGGELLQRIRRTNSYVPVLVLTARDSIDDKVKLFELGADDYLTKPFAFAELLARLNALARRPPTQEMAMALRVADLEVDLLRRTVTRSGARIDLQPREYQILEFLLRHAGRVVTRTMLLESVWDFHFDPKTNIVETHMSRLRAKLYQEGAPDLIHTVRGAGYCLREP